MIKNINNTNNLPSLVNQVELELLEVLLETEDAAYPWNPADDQAETYFDELEQHFDIQDLSEEELHTRSQSFYEKLDNLWSQVASCSHYDCSIKVGIFNNLCENLRSTFVSGVPTGWLNMIAQKATEVVATQQSMGEQLIECVQSVLPDWCGEDLSVFARPYVYAMRSNEQKNIASIVNKVENQDWTTLSEIEQAKLSVAIAYYALRQLQTEI